MVFIGGNKRHVKNERLEIICLSLEKFLTSIPFHKVGKNIKDFLLWFASPKTFPKIPKTIPWPWPQLVAIYTPLKCYAEATISDTQQIVEEQLLQR